MSRTSTVAGLVLAQSPTEGSQNSLAVSDCENSSVLNEVARAAALALGTPVALVTVILQSEQCFAGSFGLAEPLASTRRTPLSTSYCRFVVERACPVAIVDASKDPLVADIGAWRDGFVAYLGVPVRDDRGVVVASLAVAQPAAREWLDKDRAILESISRLIPAERVRRLLVETLDNGSATALQVEARLRDSEVRLRQALKAGQAGIWSWNAATRALDWDDLNHALYGFRQNEPPSFQLWIGSIHPDDRASVLARLRTSLDDPDLILREEVRVRHPEGERWMLVLGDAERDAEGKLLRLSGINIDVTERRRAEEALRLSERRFQQIAGAIDEVFHITDPVARKLLYVSPAYERIWGRSPAPVFASLDAFLETVHSDDRARIASESGKPHEASGNEAEYRIVRPDGEVRWILDRVYPVDASDNGGTHLVGVAQDITDQRRVLSDLRESEARYRQALEVGRIGAWETDFEKGSRRWSPEAMTLFGLDLPGGIGRVGGPNDEWRRSFHEDDRAIGDAVYERLSREDAFDVEYRIRRADGEVLHLHGHARVESRDASGRPLKLVNVVADITAMRRAEKARDDSERQFRAAAEAMPGMLFVSSPTEGNISVNESYRHYVGADEHELLGKGWTRFVHPADLAAGLKSWATASAARSVYQAEMRFRRHDGAWRWHLARAQPIQQSDGTIERWVGTCTDIHERKESEAELQAKVVDAVRDREAALLQLHEAQKTEIIGQLTGGVAHDFNNLLAAILSNLDLARKYITDLRVAKLIDGALKGAERGAALTSRLLAFARRQDLKTVTVNLPDLFEGMRELLTRSLRADVEVRSSFPADLPAVLADVNQVELAILNLAVNARDAMPEGGSLLVEAASYVARDGNDFGLRPGAYVQLIVADTGQGMDAATLQRSTEPFFTTKGVGKGTGLGLSMVHGMAEQSGGALRIESAPGRGTTIRLFLPQATGSAAAVPTEDTLRTRPQTDLTDQPLTTLVVDDDVLVGMGTAAMLEDLGHMVLEASSGQSAIELIAAHPEIDIVITDQSMPGMTGLQLAGVIRGRWPKLPIVLASGYTDLPDGQTTELPRLSKPFRQEDLAQVLKRVIDECRQQT